MDEKNYGSGCAQVLFLIDIQLQMSGIGIRINDPPVSGQIVRYRRMCVDKLQHAQGVGCLKQGLIGIAAGRRGGTGRLL